MSRSIADLAAADGLAAADLYNQDGHKLAAFQSKERTASIQANYAPPEAIDAFLFLQGLFEPHPLPEQRTSQFLHAQARLALKDWKGMVDKVRRQMMKERKQLEVKWANRIKRMNLLVRKKESANLSLFLTDLKAESDLLQRRSHLLHQQILDFVLVVKKTSLGRLIEHANDVQMDEKKRENMKVDDQLLVRMFRLLRKTCYSYLPHDALEFIQRKNYGLGEEEKFRGLVSSVSDSDEEEEEERKAAPRKQPSAAGKAATSKQAEKRSARPKPPAAAAAAAASSSRAPAAAEAGVAAGLKRKQSTGNDERKQGNKKSKPNTQKK